MSQPPRRCRHCHDPLAGPNNQKYCNKPGCQSVRKAMAAQARANAPLTGVCVICGAPFELLPNTKPGRKSCFNPECVLEQRRRSGRVNIARNRVKGVTVECNRCEKKFNTVLVGAPPVPRFRSCPECRRTVSLEYRFADAW